MRLEPQVERSDILRLTLLQSAIFLAGATAYALLVGNSASIGVTQTGSIKSIVWGIVLFVVFIPVLYLPRRLKIKNELEEAIGGKLGIRDILSLNALVSVSEELFFRGFLLRVIGVVPSAAVFGAMHYIGYASVLEVAYALSTGLVLGYLYRLYLPNILFPITFHYLANAFALLLTKVSLAERR